MAYLDQPVVSAFLEAARGAGGIERILLFGSRARGDFQERSDYDFAVSAPNLSPLERAAFAGRWLETKPTLLRTDIVWLDDMGDEALSKIIREEGVEIYARKLD